MPEDGGKGGEQQHSESHGKEGKEIRCQQHNTEKNMEMNMHEEEHNKRKEPARVIHLCRYI